MGDLIGQWNKKNNKELKHGMIKKRQLVLVTLDLRWLSMVHYGLCLHFTSMNVLARNFSLYLTLEESSDKLRSTRGIFKFEIASLEETRLFPSW